MSLGDRRGRPGFSSGGAVNSWRVKIPEAAFGRSRDLSGQVGYSQQGLRRKALERPQVHDQWIALIFKVEFEPLR